MPKSFTSLIKGLLISMRIWQWYKNLVVFIALIFSGNLFNFSLLYKSTLTFFAFCLLSSSIYIINDINDIERDKIHPKKKNRPIASGVISINIGRMYSIFLAILSLGMLYLTNTPTFLIGTLYLFTNILYTFFLKNLFIIDVLTLGIGYILRALAGVTAINVELSYWLVIMVFVLALILGFGKRRYEYNMLGENKTAHRSVLVSYVPEFLDSILSISAATLLLSYLIYVITVNTRLIYTIPFVFYGIFRYVALSYSPNSGGTIEFIIKDKPLILNAILWIIFVICCLYI